MSTTVVGVDFDHTLVCYDAILPRLVDRFVGPEVLRSLPPGSSKTAIRDALRALPDGERRWQEIQARLYGPALTEARPFAGALEALTRLRRRGVALHVISHKTQFARRPVDGRPVDLRTAALAWLKREGFLSTEGPDLSATNFHFLDSRAEKAHRIHDIGCDAFVDDLAETFDHPDFPADVLAVHFAPGDEADDSQATPDAPDRDRASGSTTRQRLRSWSQLEALLETAGVLDEVPVRRSRHARTGPIDPSLEALVRSALASRVVWRQRLSGGRNSRVEHLELDDGREIIAKRYAATRPDRRDAQEHEARSLAFLSAVPVCNVPRLLAVDPNSRWSLLSMLPGLPHRSTRIDREDCDALLAFLRDLDTASGHADAPALPAASEAAFSVGQLIAHSRRRLARLHTVVEGADGSDEPILWELDRFLGRELEPAHRRFADEAADNLRAVDLDLDADLDPSLLRLTPSDVGFHNGLRTDEGTWSFFDFEHFGWDDPAKTLADLLLHPGNFVPWTFRKPLLLGRLRDCADDLTLSHRLRAGYRLAGVQWCLILLNEFVPADRARRRHAGRGLSRDPRPHQLSRARVLLHRLHMTDPLVDTLPLAAF